MPFYKSAKSIMLPLVCPGLKRGLGSMGELGEENTTVQEMSTQFYLRLTTAQSNVKQVVGNWVFEKRLKPRKGEGRAMTWHSILVMKKIIGCLSYFYASWSPQVIEA